MMDLDQLQSVRDRERQTDTLQQLRGSFYADAADLVADLRAQREEAAAAAEEPLDDPTVSRLSDRIDTAERTVEAIYERRVGKIVKAATFAAADQPAETEGMTTEEQDLFEALVGEIRANRQRVLAVLAGEASPDSGDAGEGAPAEAREESNVGGEEGDPAVGAADLMGGGAEPREPPPPEALEEGPPPEDSRGSEGDGPDSPGGDGDVAGEAGEDGGVADPPPPAETEEGEATASVPRETVRITADVGDIFGVDDREYDLSEDDVVSLPAENVEPLVERGAAERID